ncbi:MAG TPA: VOC family protein [Bryobacteraceae bacterium]|nr:VOC family protein [Bryobacteraceae bacterium]
MIHQIAPQFFTTDIAGTVGYYGDKLGFECLGTWQDPPIYAIVARDQHTIHFRCAAPPMANRDKYTDELLDAYPYIEDADAFYGEYTARGVEFVRELANMPWRAREFVVKDCDAGCWRSGRGCSALFIVPDQPDGSVQVIVEPLNIRLFWLYGHSKVSVSSFHCVPGVALLPAGRERSNCAVCSPHTKSSERRDWGERWRWVSDCKYRVQLDNNGRTEDRGHGFDAKREDVRGRKIFDAAEHDQDSDHGGWRRGSLSGYAEFLEPVGEKGYEVPSGSPLWAAGQ